MQMNSVIQAKFMPDRVQLYFWQCSYMGQGPGPVVRFNITSTSGNIARGPG